MSLSCFSFSLSGVYFFFTASDLTHVVEQEREGEEEEEEGMGWWEGEKQRESDRGREKERGWICWFTKDSNMTSLPSHTPTHFLPPPRHDGTAPETGRSRSSINREELLGQEPHTYTQFPHLSHPLNFLSLPLSPLALCCTYAFLKSVNTHMLQHTRACSHLLGR